jgi:hypothetical protein
VPIAGRLTQVRVDTARRIVYSGRHITQLEIFSYLLFILTGIAACTQILVRPNDLEWGNIRKNSQNNKQAFMSADTHPG